MLAQPRSHNLRAGRFSGVGQVYLVTATTRNREPVFRNWAIGRLLVFELRAAQELDLAHSLAWVVMPDHFHWLLEIRNGSLSRVMQRVKSKSAIAINKANGRQGRLWQDGYHDKAVRREQDIVRFARYVVANPLRAGLVNSVRQYSLWDCCWV